jgi:hypothetical protein
MKVWLLFFCILAYATSLSCEAYLFKMVQLYYHNQTECKKLFS